MLTQTVRGLAKQDANVHAWSTSFRQRQDIGAADLILLQEMHASDVDASRLADHFARCCGFDAAQLDQCSSLWSTTTTRTGGEAILRNPYSTVSELKLYVPERWTSHWMAATVSLRNEWVLIVNVYAPTNATSREQLFDRLAPVLRE